MLQKVNSLPQKNVIDFFSPTFILNACIHELESKTQKHKQQKLHRTIFRKQKSFCNKKGGSEYFIIMSIIIFAYNSIFIYLSLAYKQKNANNSQSV